MHYESGNCGIYTTHNANTWVGDGMGRGRAGLGGVLLIALHFTHLTHGGGTLTRMPIVGCQQLCQTKHGQSVGGREVHILNSHMEATKCDGLELKVEHHQPCQIKKQIPTPDTSGGVFWAYWPNLLLCCSWSSQALKAFHTQRNLWIRGQQHGISNSLWHPWNCICLLWTVTQAILWSSVSLWGTGPPYDQYINSILSSLVWAVHVHH